ncbi:MAG: cytochrome c, partial [Rhodopila sp.]|nr:cytochrome c [Rhodopila sp.]
MRKIAGFAAACAVLGAVGIAAVFVTRQSSPLSGDVANDPALVQRGAYIAVAGDCAACHTRPGGNPFAGGLALQVPMLGTIYSPNITPENQTGTGRYTLADFDRAVRFGVRKDGANLYPAMPYPSYAKMTDEDVRALYAYFKYGVPAVAQKREAGTIAWPLNIRWPLQIWDALFLDTKPYQEVAGHDDAWNRGAYLAQGLAHCGTCHTPRGLFMQETALDQQGEHYLGGGGIIGGWQAFNITSDTNSGIGGWSKDQLTQYLGTGNVPGLAQAAGPMNEAVVHSFSKMTPEDISAIATYVKT